MSPTTTTAMQAPPRSPGLNPQPQPTSKPPRHRGHKPRTSDPFLELPDENPLLLQTQTQKRSPSPMPSPNDDERESSQSFLIEFLLTPINMISLLLSLYLVDYEQRSWRTAQQTRPPPQASLFPNILNLAAAAEPYQDATGRWKTSPSASPSASASAAASDGDPAAAYQGWYRRRKHRALAKLALGDALELRGRVVVAMAVWAVVAGVGVALAVKGGWALLSRGGGGGGGF